jgi:hypothetical protein
MKNKIALLSLALASSVFALDEYMPLNKGVLELDAGINPIFLDPEGTVIGVPLQAKYGIMDGLDVELGLYYASLDEDAGGGASASGFTQPAVAVKYKVPGMDLAAFVNVTLPFATGDFDVDGLNLGVSPGVLYNHTLTPEISAILGAQYQINMEADDIKDGNILGLLAKPNYAVSKELGAYVLANYNMYSETEVAGTGMGDDGYAFILSPGITYTLSPSIAFEANLPYVVAEDNYGKSVGIWASVYYTLPL